MNVTPSAPSTRSAHTFSMRARHGPDSRSSIETRKSPGAGAALRLFGPYLEKVAFAVVMAVMPLGQPT
jgi:hypothetical protein